MQVGRVSRVGLMHLPMIDPMHYLMSSLVSSQFCALTDVCDSVYAQWLRGRASDSRLREPGFESCAAALKPWERLLTLHSSSSLGSINEYLAIDKWWLCVLPSRINSSIWLDASQRS